MGKDSSFKVIIITILIMMFCILSVRSENLKSRIAVFSGDVVNGNIETTGTLNFRPAELNKEKCRRGTYLFNFKYL